MPLVVSRKSKSAHYVRNEEILGEVLGHSDFDGHDWAIGDLIIFEDGTSAAIEQFPNDRFYTWSERTAMDVASAVVEVQKFGDPRLPLESDVTTFDRLFFLMSQPLPGERRREFIRTIYFLLFIGLIVAACKFAFSK